MWTFKLSRSLVKAVNTSTKMPKWGCCRSASSIQKSQESKKSPEPSTIDALDVQLFSKQMKEWWNLDGPMRMLHSFNTLRVPFVRDGMLQCAPEQRELNPLNKKKILDVGCGGGILSEGLARLGAVVTGVDASQELITVAKEHSNVDPKIANNKPTYYNTTIEEHAKEYANYYDGVVASEVIEHVNNQELFVKSCLHTLKPGGRIFFTTPSRTRLSQLVVIFLCENVLKLVPQGAHQYEKFLTPNELTFMLEKNNCHVESTYGIQYNPITNKWDFTRYQQLMFAIQAQKLS